MNQRNIPDTPSPDPAASAEESTFADILFQFEQGQRKTDSAGGSSSLKGTVISVSADLVMVDIGRKLEGSLSIEQVRDAAGSVPLKPGDTIQVSVTGRGEDGYYRLSTTKVVVPKDWSGMEKAFADKAIVSGVVEEVIKGGLRVDIGARAFLPASRSGTRDAEEMAKLVGQEIECRITKLDVDNEDIVVDRRGILDERAGKAKEAAFANLKEGDVVTGTVRSLMEFGAFVDLGGVDGLLHVAEMSWSRGAKPADIVKVGDQIQVKILKIQADAHKVSLSLKQLQADPWTVAAETYKVGDRVRGTVTRVADFGAFVQLQAGVEGLIHVSEMSWARKQTRASDVLKHGEAVEAVILSVSQADKRIGLGLKQLLGDPWEEAVRKYPAGTNVEGTVISLQPFGAFIDLGSGIEGMIHIGDITREKRLDHPKDLLTVGKTVRAQVSELDQQRKRIRLSMKALEPTSADEYIAEHQVGEEVTGRVIDVGKERAKVELGDGVTGSCRLQPKAAAATAPPADRSASDIASLTAMLEAKWKKGQDSGGSAGDQADVLRTGQIRRFKIINLDASQKRIEVEPAG
ncbi:MAG: S1 RNA-binding domain-containing protein [Acidobacteriia bacterium]|nr:S1 RNA-binding domain-containing protein [Terriglobia bacterium]